MTDHIPIGGAKSNQRKEPDQVDETNRMPTEMRVMAMRDAAARDTAITHTPEFVRFGVNYREVIR
jgi:hypothetical protein